MHTNKMEQIAKNIRDLEDRDGETTLLTNFDEVGRSGKQPVLRGGAVLGVGGDQGQPAEHPIRQQERVVVGVPVTHT